MCWSEIGGLQSLFRVGGGGGVVPDLEFPRSTFNLDTNWHIASVCISILLTIIYLRVFRRLMTSSGPKMQVHDN